MNNPSILEKIYKYYPLVHEKSCSNKVKMRKNKIDQKIIYKNELITRIITIAKGYKVVDWTDDEACCYEFRILLHKNTTLLDDDKMLIKNLNGERKDLRIFISVLEPYYYMFIEKTSYFESQDKWEFTTEETNVSEYEKLKEKIISYLCQNGYIGLSHSDVLMPVPKVETTYKENDNVTVFDCLFTDLVNIT